DLVVALGALQAVVAVAAVDDIVAVGSIDVVIAVIAEQLVVAVAALDGIVVEPAREAVVAVAPVEGVVAGIADQSVIAEIAVDQVVAVSAEQGIVATDDGPAIAPQRIVAIVAEQRVAAARAIDPIVAGVAMDGIGPPLSAERIIGRGAVECPGAGERVEKRHEIPLPSSEDRGIAAIPRTRMSRNRGSKTLNDCGKAATLGPVTEGASLPDGSAGREVLAQRVKAKLVQFQVKNHRSGSIVALVKNA